jgi:hypothetical protein
MDSPAYIVPAAIMAATASFSSALRISAVPFLGAPCRQRISP